mmetsp:Transcript_86743/g.280855  ORF Transcript_86743/g.280855 Transcript_86743/m.280855 type:complete len:735 (-) Transcript_86743:68-2272(-)
MGWLATECSPDTHVQFNSSPRAAVSQLESGKEPSVAIQPTRLGIMRSPPQLVVEYFEGPKRRLHHVHLRADSLQRSTKRLVAELKNHPQHGAYVHSVQAQQLGELLRRLRVAVMSEDAEPAKAGRLKGSGHRGRSTPPGPVARQHRQPQAPGDGPMSAPTPARSSWNPPARALSHSSGDDGVGDARGTCGRGGCGTGDAPWPTGAWYLWSLARGESSEQIAELFEEFRKSRGVVAIAESFARLFRASASGSDVQAAQPSGAPFEVIRAAVGQQRRLARVLWERLDARCSMVDYCRRPLSARRAVVVGAGPIGLRCALELRLLGAEVAVLERRVSFDRINRLHLWPWCGEDLKGWGAKVLEPPELSFGSDPDFLHIGIAELQMLLLKACLLLGVQVFFGTEYVSSRPAHAEDACPAVWEILVRRTEGGDGEAAEDPPGPVAPLHFRGVSVLVGADGPRGGVARAHGLELVETSSLRKESALGLVMNFANKQTAAEKRMRPFSLARQFYEALFKDCEQQTGVALENIVCYTAPQTHYLVMTPTRKSLQRVGVYPEDAADGGAINQAALARAARAVCAFPWKPEQGALPAATLDAPVSAPALFDFSKTRRAGGGVRVVESPAAEGCLPARMFVGLCGDALIEPFWPEGLGIVRGFFAALDLASAARVWAETGDDKEAIAHFEAAYGQLKSVAAKTRQAVLRPDEQAYGLDPTTRYRFASAEGRGVRASSMPAMRVGR